MSYLGTKPANSPLTSELIPDGLISTSDIADSAITTAKIAAGAVIQADLATGVAGTGPAFSAYQSSAQTLSTNVATKIQFQTEEFDTASCFDNSTNYRFTPTVAGYYQINGGIQVAVSVTVINVWIYKNGSLAKPLFTSNSSIVSGGYGSALVYLNGSTDYIELYGQLGSGQTLNVSGGTWSYFQASIVRAA